MKVSELQKWLFNAPPDWEVRVQAGRYGLEEPIVRVISVTGRRTGVIIQIPEDR